MFGFSIQKLLFTVLVAAAVWYGFKWYARIQSVRDSKRDSAKVNRGGGQGGQAGGQLPDTEDMVKCGSCGVFVAAKGARSCGRADCPYSG